MSKERDEALVRAGWNDPHAMKTIEKMIAEVDAKHPPPTAIADVERERALVRAVVNECVEIVATAGAGKENPPKTAAEMKRYACAKLEEYGADLWDDIIAKNAATHPRSAPTSAEGLERLATATEALIGESFAKVNPEVGNEAMAAVMQVRAECRHGVVLDRASACVVCKSPPPTRMVHAEHDRAGVEAAQRVIEAARDHYIREIRAARAADHAVGVITHLASCRTALEDALAQVHIVTSTTPPQPVQEAVGVSLPVIGACRDCAHREVEEGGWACALTADPNEPGDMGAFLGDGDIRPPPAWCPLRKPARS